MVAHENLTPSDVPQINLSMEIPWDINYRARVWLRAPVLYTPLKRWLDKVINQSINQFIINCAQWDKEM